MRPAIWRCLLTLAALSVAVSGPVVRAADDGRRAVEVKRYGIKVRVPQAWRLITWGRDDQAFVLKLPQDPGSKSGYVKCELGIAPENLKDYLARQQASEAQAKDEADGRKLLENRLEPIDEKKFGKELARLGERLFSVWEVDSPTEHVFEMRTRVISDGTLYTFSMATDEAHFEAYRLDFEEMFASSIFSPPEMGLRRMPGGYWMQRDYRFAMRLPEGWKPAFGPNDKVLFFATGTSHGAFTDNLLVLASPVRELKFEELKESLPGEVAKVDPQAKVTCQTVPQGGTAALETVIETKRGQFNITVLERRFRSNLRNYEVKFTCETSEFKKVEADLRKALDTFIEVVEDANRAEA
jgi:hypothetical protein